LGERFQLLLLSRCLFVSGHAAFFNTVFQVRDTMLAGAISAAIQSIGGLHPMTDDPAATVRAGWRKCMDGALETVECMRLSTYSHLEAFVVGVATHFTGRCLIAQNTFTFIHAYLFSTPQALALTGLRLLRFLLLAL
jgi:hypothetical protein